MPHARPQIVIVCGPTATGKTQLAVRLAARFGGEIVNADSMQVYRHMDIGTAKPDADERRAARFHLVDVADPDDTFSTGRFKDMAQAAVEEILARGHVPIVAGGTGLYIKALTQGLFDGPSADPQLRAAYKVREAAEPGSLYRRLREVDPERAAQVEPGDYVRIERSLEVFDLTGKPLSRWIAEHRFAEEPYETLKIGLHRERDDLAAACDRRVLTMMDKGWLDEVRALRERGYGPQLPSQMAIGYKELHQFLDKQFSLSEAVRRAQTSTRKFAKRQRTWFGADKGILWHDAAATGEQVLERVARFLQI
ncbi:MAG TPA: tRNA (adenosine(37)-N6)-dimethylallyltransferase MiaA [bacterium]|nr:tRNA (adenosine(37)-N6)-dimethylallyltransferase MiaA [bacterium]